MIASKLATAAAALLTALLVQAGFIGPLTFPLPVSLPALLVITTAIYAGPGVGVGLGFVTGLIADLGSDHPAGVLALCWLAAGLVGGLLGSLVARRGYCTRQVAALAATIAAGTSLAVTVLLTALDSHGATIWLAVRDVVPVGLTDALLGLILVPMVASMLRLQGVRAPRGEPEFVGAAFIERSHA